MGYFQELPNILHPSLFPSRNKVESTILVKNLFKRSKLRTDVDQAITAFNYFDIKKIIKFVKILEANMKVALMLVQAPKGLHRHHQCKQHI